MRYNQQYYKDVFNDPASIKQLDESVSKPSLLQLIEVSCVMSTADSILTYWAKTSAG